MVLSVVRLAAISRCTARDARHTNIKKGSLRELDRFLIFLKSIHPAIDFTMETEEYNRINFLDITIMREDNKHNFKIYRKPTHTDMVIHRTSNHPWKYKMSAFRSMVWRALTVPMNQKDLDNEICTIKQIAVNNDYKPDIIDKLRKTIQKKINNRLMNGPHSLDESNKKYRRVLYVGKTTDKIVKQIKSIGVEPALYTNHNLSKILNNSKMKIKSSPYLQSGVYRLKCSESGCNAEYIGRTLRPAKVRWSEHVATKNRINSLNKEIKALNKDLDNINHLITNNTSARKTILNKKLESIIKTKNKKIFTLNRYKKDSAFAKHLIEESHEFKLEDAMLIHRESKALRLNQLEALEIYLSNKNKNVLTLNEQTEVSNSPLFKQLQHMNFSSIT